ncbi:MFS transporter [Acidimangrovimonas sediminis]|uniref:MFS transporter n=1 Tax=Acidimangrovimonas sediminis TaxID=2056283 RepID=UPI000C80E9F5|nr:MFS transporter [Acidimangrovimonas sediminis]
MSPAKDPQAITRRIAVVVFIGGMGGGLVFPILPALGIALGIPGFMVGLILSANRIARLIFNLPAGHLIGQLGPRRILTFALGVETVGILCFSAALHLGHAQWWLLTGRFIFGIGTAFLFVGSQAAVLMLSDRGDRGRKTSTVRVAQSVAVPFGLVFGGVMANYLGDDAAFLAGAAVTALSAAYAFTALPAMGPRKADPEGAGKAGFRAILQSPGIVFVFGAWMTNFLIFLTVQGVLLATLVLLVQDRKVQIFGMEAQGTSGVVMAVMIAASAGIAMASGKMIDAARWRTTLMFPALAVLGMGFAVLGLAQGVWEMLAGVLLVGLSFNAVTLPMMALLGDHVTRAQHGPAVGIYQFVGDIGGTIGPIAGVELAIHAGLGPLYVGLGILIVLVIAPVLWLNGRERRAAAPA